MADHVLAAPPMDPCGRRRRAVRPRRPARRSRRPAASPRPSRSSAFRSARTRRYTPSSLKNDGGNPATPLSTKRRRPSGPPRSILGRIARERNQVEPSEKRLEAPLGAVDEEPFSRRSTTRPSRVSVARPAISPTTRSGPPRQPTSSSSLRVLKECPVCQEVHRFEEAGLPMAVATRDDRQTRRSAERRPTSDCGAGRR